MVNLLIISNIVSVGIIFFLLFKQQKNKKIALQEHIALTENAKKVEDLEEENHVLEMELGFVKSIYKAKLLNIGKEKQPLQKTK